MDQDSILIQQVGANRAKMFWSSFLCVLPGFARGSTLSYLTISVAHYLDDQNTSGIVMSEEQASWFVCLSSPMQMVGLMISGWLTDRFGRRLTLMGSCVLMIISALVLFLAPSYYVLLIGVTISGFGQGMVGPPAYLLLSEISLIRYRGTLGSMNTMTNNGGYLYGLIVGKSVPYKFLPFVSIMPALLFLCLSWALVESPLWHAKKGRFDLSEKTLAWLRGPNYSCKAELKELESLTSSKTSAPLSLLMGRSFLIPLSITIICFGTQVLTSIDTLSFYMLTIVKRSNLPIGDVVMAVLCQAFCTIAYMIAPLLMAKFRRRPLYLLTTLVMGLAVFTLGALSYAGSTSLFGQVSSIICLWVVFTMYGLGTGPVGFSLVGELFPQELRSFGCSLAISSRWIFSFLDVKMYSWMEANLGMGGVYFLHSGFVAVGVTLAFFLLPETKDLSFTELQQLYGKHEANEKKEFRDKKKMQDGTENSYNSCNVNVRQRNVSCSS